MLKFAVKNMLTKKVQMFLIMISIAVSTCVALISFNVSKQISDGITDTAGYYSVLIGNAGSSTQLAMNTMYFIDESCGTIPYSLMNELLADNRVRQVIPFAMADSYNGYRVVGTTPEYLATKQIDAGSMFEKSGLFEVVVGSNVAKTCSLHVGSEIHTSHSVGDEHKQSFAVVGILKETHTVYDNTVFTQLKSIWEVHEHEEEHEEHEEGEHEHAEENMVCAYCVKTKNPAYAMTLATDYDGRIITHDEKTYILQAIEPMSVVRSVLEETNTTKYIVYALCAVILAMNILVICIITLLNMYYARKEIDLMRLVGISTGKINLLYLIENSLSGIIACALALGMSRLLMGCLGGYVASMGVVLDTSRIYAPEFAILAGVFALSVLPTIVCTTVLSRQYAKV